MTQIFKEDGQVVPVTVVAAGPCFITYKKDLKKDGYRSIQLGINESKKINKPLAGFFKKFLKKDVGYKHLKEFRLREDDVMYDKLNLGQEIPASIFNLGDIVAVSGISKGKGFQGVVKRHHFHGSPASHGHKDQLRMPGSIGATGPAHVFKGTRMGGHMGSQGVTQSGLEVIKVEDNLIYIKGSVPGSRRGYIYLKAKGEFEVLSPVVESVKKDIPTSAPESKESKDTPEADLTKSTQKVVETPVATPEEKTSPVAEKKEAPVEKPVKSEEK